jgi:putative ABC transport system permease protein
VRSLWQDLRYATRILRSSPGFTAVAVLTLALGIGANTAIFSVVKALLLDSLPYRQPDRLVTLAESDPATVNPINVSYGAVEDWKSRTHSFQSVALQRDWTPTYNSGDAPEITYGLRVSRNFFDTLGVHPALGRVFFPEEDRPDRWHVVVLSYPFWVRRFGGDSQVIGRTILLNQVPFMIVGVLPQAFQSLSFNNEGHTPELWAPLGYDLSLPEACRSCQHLRAVARLRDGVSVEQARAEMKAVAARLAGELPDDYPPDSSVAVMPLRESWYRGVRSALWLLLGATGLVLLISCVNVSNLLLTRIARKRSELALRSALGATRSRLLRQLLTESTLLSVLGALAGICAAWWGTALLVSRAPANVPRLNEIHFDYPILVFTLSLSIAVGITTGLIPALQASLVNHGEALEQMSRRSTLGASRGRARSLLVASEICLALVLTISAGLLLKSLARAVNVNPGFNPANVYGVNLALQGARYQDDSAAVRFEREALDRIRSIPGVEAAAIVSTLPCGGDFDQRGFNIRDRRIPDPQVPSVDAYYVSPDYSRVMNIRILRGRGFTEADLASTSPVALISDITGRQILPGEDPIGKQIQLGGRRDDKPWATIVGIVEDVRQYGPDTPPTAQAYELFSQNPPAHPVLVIRSAISADALTAAVKEQIAGLDSTVPVYEPFLMNDLLAVSLAQRRFTVMLLACFGLLALLLAAIGIYGVTSSVVAQRTNEFGVRMALGAQPADILRLVSREGMLRAVSGLLAGLAIFLAFSRVLSSQLFEVRAADPLTVAGAVLLLAAVAFAASYIPARRATRVDPMVALRYE